MKIISKISSLFHQDIGMFYKTEEELIADIASISINGTEKKEILDAIDFLNTHSDEEVFDLFIKSGAEMVFKNKKDCKSTVRQILFAMHKTLTQ